MHRGLEGDRQDTCVLLAANGALAVHTAHTLMTLNTDVQLRRM